jgi:hypothetical protein
VLSVPHTFATRNDEDFRQVLMCQRYTDRRGNGICAREQAQNYQKTLLGVPDDL